MSDYKNNNLDLFSLRGLIGKGSYGKVFRVMTRDKKIFAAKVYDTQMMIGDFIGKNHPWHYGGGIFETFFQELIIYSKIGYNIPYVTNVVSVGMGYIIFPEYTMGDLNSIQISDLAGSWKRIFYQICLGVRNLHINGIAHLDLKPHNILFNEDMTPHICDLGSGAVIPSKELIFEGIPTDRYGTQIYQPPEALISLRNISGENDLNKLSFHVDIWSLGCILYNLITDKLFISPPESPALDKAGRLILGSSSDILKVAGAGTTTENILRSFSAEMHYGEFFDILEQSVKPGCDDSLKDRLSKNNAVNATEEELSNIADLLIEIFHPNPMLRPTILQILEHPLFEEVDVEDIIPDLHSLPEYVIPKCAARERCASYISSMDVYERAKHLGLSIVDRYIISIGPINADNSSKMDIYLWAFSAVYLACICFTEYFYNAFQRVAEQAIGTNIDDIRAMAMTIAKRLNLQIYDITPYELTHAEGNPYPFSKYADTNYASGNTVRGLVELY